MNPGNDVYEVLVQLASLGKSLYQDSNEARYNDYVLYHEKANADTPVLPTT